MKFLAAAACLLASAHARELEAWPVTTSYSYIIDEVAYETEYSYSYSTADGVTTSYSYSYQESYSYSNVEWSYSTEYTDSCTAHESCEPSPTTGEIQFCQADLTCEHCSICCDSPHLALDAYCPTSCECVPDSCEDGAYILFLFSGINSPQTVYSLD